MAITIMDCSTSQSSDEDGYTKKDVYRLRMWSGNHQMKWERTIYLKFCKDMQLVQTEPKEEVAEKTEWGANDVE